MEARITYGTLCSVTRYDGSLDGKLSLCASFKEADPGDEGGGLIVNHEHYRGEYSIEAVPLSPQAAAGQACLC